MNHKRSWLVEVVAFCLIGVSLLICSFLVFLVLSEDNSEEVETVMSTIDLKEMEWLTVVPVMNNEELSLRIFINQVDITDMTREELEETINDEVELQRQRTIKATYEGQSFEITRGKLGLSLEGEIEKVLDEVETYRRETLLLEDIHQTRIPIIEKFNLSYRYEEEKVMEWIKSIRSKVDDPVVEPSLIEKSYGRFEQTPGSSGKHVMEGRLRRAITSTLSDVSNSVVEVEIFLEEVHPQRDVTLLDTVDTRISTFTSYFPLHNAGRAENVRLATRHVNQTLLMPGDEFSYAEAISPVTVEAGYKKATIFLNGQPVDGIGGGVCQVSSTMYNAQLHAGIIAKERQNHSRIVDYVPRGQDATMALGLIDYRFVNTLDYPIYISAYTEGGALTVEFWSNSEALSGMTYRPKTIFYGITEDGRRRYDTTLYGYNSKGEIVYEEFLHRSIYRVRN